MLFGAIDDGVITSNPAARLGKTLRLAVPVKQRQEEIKAMDRNQLQAFLIALRNAKKRLDRGYLPVLPPPRAYGAEARRGARAGVRRPPLRG